MYKQIILEVSRKCGVCGIKILIHQSDFREKSSFSIVVFEKLKM